MAREMPSDVPAKSSKCGECGATIKRPEHLRRHMLIHTRSSGFACSSCHKRFSRHDSLRRHERQHIAVTSSGSEDRSRSGRACRPCSKARAKCTREHPCKRCDERSIQCAYPEQKRNRQRRDGRSNQAGPEQGLVEHEWTPLEQRISDPQPSASSLETTQSTNEGSLLQNTVSVYGDPAIGVGLQQVDRCDDGGQAGGVIIPSGNTTVPDIQGGGSENIDWGTNINWLPYIDDMDEQPAFNLPLMLNILNQGRFSNMETDSDNLPSQASKGASPGSNNLQHMMNHFEDSIASPQSCDRSSSSLGLSVVTSTDNNASPPTLYAERAGSRNTAYTRLRVKRSLRVRLPLEENKADRPITYSFNKASPAISELELDDSLVPETMYLLIYGNFQKACVNCQYVFEAFQTDYLPPREFFVACSTIYFEHLDGSFPIIHRPTLGYEPSEWLVILAVVALGARQACTDSMDQNEAALTEFLRRCLLLESSAVTGYSFSSNALAYAQASLLYIIGQFRLGEGYDSVNINILVAQLATVTRKRSWLQDNGTRGLDSVDWMNWLEMEKAKRVGYGVWLIDYHLASTFQPPTVPAMCLSDVQTALPCHPSLWQADTQSSWVSLSQTSNHTPFFQSLLHDLYRGKQYETNYGYLSELVLIHGLCRRTYEVGNHFSEPLWTINPAARAATGTDSYEHSTPWLPSIATYEKWRNCALDSLDLLHWSANAEMFKKRGLEPRIILHLHLARLVLLTPLKDIQCIIEERKLNQTIVLDAEGTERSLSSARFQESLSTIWRWLLQDTYKARLSIIHAGAVFWHVRRYSSGSFFEPTTLFLSAIVLWAYSTYNKVVHDSTMLTHPEQDESRVANQSSTAPVKYSQPSTDESEPLAELVSGGPKLIMIDRPCDDELVQYFIRKGSRMEARMQGIGPIDQTDAPRKITEQAIQILELRCSSWNISRSYCKVLESLSER